MYDAYDAVEIAKVIIDRCTYLGKPISNLKLQKLLYYVQGYSYKYFNKPAFHDNICAWAYGPVVPTVYEEFSSYASKKMTLHFCVTKTDDEIKSLIYEVIDKFIDIPVWQLADKTHDEDPWKYSYLVFGLNAVIPKNSIKKYFFSGIK